MTELFRLDLTGTEREILIIGLSRLVADSMIRSDARDLLERVVCLCGDGDPTIDVSGPRHVYCNACNTEAESTRDLLHRPGCAWVARYGR